MKKLLSFLLAAVMVISTSVAAFAADEITSGTYPEKPTNLAEGYVACYNEDESGYVVGKLPEAEVGVLTENGPLTLKDSEYQVFNGGLSDGTEDLTMPFALQFTAKDTAEEAKANAFGYWNTDFYISITGVSGEIDLTGCYLVGQYNIFDTRWVAIPLDSVEIVGGTVYPVLGSMTVDWFEYWEICNDVKQFNCGIYLTDAVMEKYPDLQVNLELRIAPHTIAAGTEDAAYIKIGDTYTYPESEAPDPVPPAVEEEEDEDDEYYEDDEDEEEEEEEEEEPVEIVSVPVSGDENTVRADASISGGTAVVEHISTSNLDKVIGEDVDTGAVTIDLSNLTKSVNAVKLPAGVVEDITDAVLDPENDTHSLEVILPGNLSITFDAEALAEKISQAKGDDIKITMKRTTQSNNTINSRQEETVGDRPAYSIKVSSGGRVISDMGGDIILSFPYKLGKGEKAEHLVVYYVDKNGKKEACATSYDSRKQMVSAVTDHLSVYMIGYDVNTVNAVNTVVESDRNPNTGAI